MTCFFGDYSQILALPYLGHEQAGPSYYWSPLSIHVFGLADIPIDTLNAFIYHEGDGEGWG